MAKNLDATFPGGDLTADDFDDARGPQEANPPAPTPGVENTLAPPPVARWSPRKVFIQDSDRHLYIDIETVPDWERLARHGIVRQTDRDDPVTWEEVLSTIKDGTVADFMNLLPRFGNPSPEALSALIEAEKERKHPRSTILSALTSYASNRNAAFNTQSKEYSVTPEYCRIVALGYAIGNGPIETLLCKTYDEERNVLGTFWQLVSDYAPIVGYNHIAFDLPVIFVRSGILRVRPSRKLDMSPFGKSRDVVDLMRARFGNNKAQGLKKLAALYGIPMPPWKTDGGDIDRLFSEQKWDEITQYLESDVALTREVYGFLKGTFCD